MASSANSDLEYGEVIRSCYGGSSEAVKAGLVVVAANVDRFFARVRQLGVDPGVMEQPLQDLLLPGFELDSYVKDRYGSDPIAYDAVAQMEPGDIHNAILEQPKFRQLAEWCINTDPIRYIAEAKQAYKWFMDYLPLAQEDNEDIEGEYAPQLGICRKRKGTTLANHRAKRPKFFTRT